MFGSLTLGRVLGIPIRIHWIVLILMLFVANGSPAPLRTLGYLLVLILVVGLHELGHCIVARRFGARVFDITFWPLGGMARMSDIPEDTKAEASIALAGPAVNFVLAALTVTGLALAYWLAPDNWWDGWGLGSLGLPAGEIAGYGGIVQEPGFGEMVGRNLLQVGHVFLAMNLLLGTFNLVPAFPMDGGRVLRAWLGRRGDWVGATERAVRVSRWLAVGMVIAGFFYSPMLPLVALFIWFAGTRELWSVRVRHGAAPFSFGNGQGSPFEAFTGRAGSAQGQNPFSGFGNFGGAANHDGQDAQDVYEEDLRAQEARPVEDLSDQGARRPSGAPAPQSSRGFTEEELRALERFPGRLRRPDTDA